MDDTLRQLLRELDREELIELIGALYGRDPVIDREIAAIAARRLPSAHERQIRTWIRDLDGRRARSSHHGSFEVGTQLDRILEEIEVLIDTGDPKTALELAEKVLKTGRSLIDIIDDSDAHISMSMRELAPVWLKAARRCRDAGIEEDWSARLEATLESDDYGLLDKLLPNSSILLTETELRELAGRFEAKADEEADGHRRRFWLNRAGTLAWPLRDPEHFARVEKLIEPAINGPRLEAIATCFLELEDPQGALRWLELPWPDHEWERSRLLARAYGALGRTLEQIAVIRSIWEKRPDVHNLTALLALLSPEEQEKAKEDASAAATAHPDIETGLELLLFLDKTADAAELCWARRAEIKGDHYYTLKEVAERFETQGHPLASSLIYRALLGSILGRGYSRAYHHAADYYEQLQLLDRRVDDWRGEPDHQAYVANLRYEHGRKSGFWSRVKGW